MTKIRNTEQLVATGDSTSRETVLAIAEATLQQLDAYTRIRSIMSLDRDLLTIGTRTWDLAQKRNVYLVGAGKACNHMAMAVDHILGDRLTHGIAIVKISEESDSFNHTEVHVGGHPIPNETGLHATKKVLALADSAGPDDLFIGVISGGSSALMSCPVDGVSLDDEKKTTDILLKSGAGIYEVNAIRRHISQANGGRVAQRINASGAELIGIGISDAVGGTPTGDIGIPYDAYMSTPLGPDMTTLEQARQVMTDYDLVERLPPTVVDYLRKAGPAQETPKAFPDNTYFLLNTLADSARYAKQAAEDFGIPALILTSFLEGESKDAGAVFAAIAREIQASGNPLPAPCVIVSAGETTTYIGEDDPITGHGGPSQELVTGFALSASQAPGAVMFSIDSEGTDGTTSAAGGLCDSTTRERALASNVDLRAALRGHATFEALDAIGDTVLTGNTGTNLCDLNILYVPALER